jgi:uncharacterized membrane protein YfcA
MHFLLLLLSAFVAGGVNSIAGGGTLLTFPSLLAAHLPSVAANATSTMALAPGSLSAFFGYREARRNQSDLIWYAVPSLFGGILGALILVGGGERFFNRLVPWLILGATLLFAVQGLVRPPRSRSGRRASAPGAPSLRRRLAGATVQFGIAVYGGFFGAGIGILMMATMGLMGFSDVHETNRLKNVCAAVINGVAAVTFALAGEVRWPMALVMAVAAIAGGYVGARFAQRIGQNWVRGMVIGIGLSIGTWMLFRPL